MEYVIVGIILLIALLGKKTTGGNGGGNGGGNVSPNIVIDIVSKRTNLILNYFFVVSRSRLENGSILMKSITQGGRAQGFYIAGTTFVSVKYHNPKWLGVALQINTPMPILNADWKIIGFWLSDNFYDWINHHNTEWNRLSDTGKAQKYLDYSYALAWGKLTSGPETTDLYDYVSERLTAVGSFLTNLIIIIRILQQLLGGSPSNPASGPATDFGQLC